ncbi:MAG: hypothetical protein IPM39_24995 [Chloroflexi bacterium]|nr:hypothetical protein [Chloroflexota bacterium]
MSKPIHIGDPDAVERLQAKLEILEKLQATMKAANKIARNSKMHPDVKIQELTKLGITEENTTVLLTPRYGGHVGFSPWQLTNNNAEITRLKGRLVQAEAATKRQSSDKTNEDGVRIEWAAEDSRVRLYFPETRVSNAMYNTLRRNGFVFARTLGAFSRMWTNNDAKHHVQTVLNAYKAEQGEKVHA